MVITTQPGARNGPKNSAENENDAENRLRNSAENETQNRAINSAENEARNGAEVETQKRSRTSAENEENNGLGEQKEDLVSDNKRSKRSAEGQGIPTRSTTDSEEVIPELQPLIPLEGVLVEQKIELLEIITTFESKNQYEVKTLSGMSMIARFKRPCRCCCCKSMLCASCCCCTDSITVEAPPGNKIGKVQQRSGCKLNFNLYYRGDRFAYIKGPSCCGCGCCTCCFLEKKFKVYSQNDRSEIGMVTKLFGGILKEYMTDADTFRVTFPVDMSANAKLIMISASLLIDFIAFEDNEGKKKTRFGT